MMQAAANPIDEQALDWLIRQRDPGFDDWEAFDAWLSADPARATAYQALAAADADMAALLGKPVPRPIMASAPRPAVSRRAWLGGAVAASLAVAVGWTVIERGSQPYAVETAPGVRRTIALEDGSRIELNGGTRLTLDRARPRYAQLERGEAAFVVVHDEARPFEVKVGDATLIDVGTIFNVARDGGETRVGVAEGAVIYNPKAEAVRLDPGGTLRARDGDTRLVVGEIEPGAIGAWREGRLVYDGAPLAEVAADLSRNLGLNVVAAPDVAAQPFRGVIMLRRDRERLMRQLEPVLGVRARRTAQGWTLTAS